MSFFRTIRFYFLFRKPKDKKGRTFAQNMAWLAGGGTLTHWKACEFLAKRD